MAYEFKLKEPLTIEKVKDCIAIPDTIGKTLRNMCDCWYKIEIESGRGEEGAAEVALDKLAEKIISLSKEALQK